MKYRFATLFAKIQFEAANLYKNYNNNSRNNYKDNKKIIFANFKIMYNNYNIVFMEERYGGVRLIR